MSAWQLGDWIVTKSGGFLNSLGAGLLFENIKIGNEIGTSLIEEDTIRLNSQERLTKRDNTYFEKIQV